MTKSHPRPQPTQIGFAWTIGLRMMGISPLPGNEWLQFRPASKRYGCKSQQSDLWAQQKQQTLSFPWRVHHFPFQPDGTKRDEDAFREGMLDWISWEGNKSDEGASLERTLDRKLCVIPTKKLPSGVKAVRGNENTKLSPFSPVRTVGFDCVSEIVIECLYVTKNLNTTALCNLRTVACFH